MHEENVVLKLPVNWVMSGLHKVVLHFFNGDWNFWNALQNNTNAIDAFPVNRLVHLVVKLKLSLHRSFISFCTFF